MVPFSDGLDSGYYLLVDRFGDLFVVSDPDDFILVFCSDGTHVESFASYDVYRDRLLPVIFGDCDFLCT